MGPCRPNPQGARGLRHRTASWLLPDVTTSHSSPFLVRYPQDPRARPTRLLPRAAKTPPSALGRREVPDGAGQPAAPLVVVEPRLGIGSPDIGSEPGRELREGRASLGARGTRLDPVQLGRDLLDTGSGKALVPLDLVEVGSGHHECRRPDDPGLLLRV